MKTANRANLAATLAVLFLSALSLSIPLTASEITTVLPDGDTIYSLLSGDGINNYTYTTNTHIGPSSVHGGSGYAESIPGVDLLWRVGIADMIHVYGDPIYGVFRFDAPEPNSNPAMTVQFNGQFLQAYGNEPSAYYIPLSLITLGANTARVFFDGPINPGYSVDILTSPNRTLPSPPSTNPTPEPGTMLMGLAGVGMLGLPKLYRRFRKQ